MKAAARSTSLGNRTLPNVILLDLQLPVQSGFEVLQYIQGQPALHNIITVILTASESERDLDRASELGAKLRLRKPCRYEDLETVAQLVSLAA